MIVNYQRPPVRVALLGLGRAMLNDHYSVFKAHPNLFNVVCACDLLKERRDLVARDFPNCRMFRRHTDMLDERGIDLVDIATCTNDHVEHALASLDRGFWTLLETPIATAYDRAQVLRGAAAKAKNRLLVAMRGMFSPDYLLTQQVRNDPRLGPVHQISLRQEDYIRRDDWQTVKRLGGGAAYYAVPDLIIRALRLLGTPPIQMWSELKRLASLGDSEDFVHVNLKTRAPVTADLEFNGGCLPGLRSPSYVLRGERGVFSVEPGAAVGKMTFIDPAFEFPRRRSSVRTPPMRELHENFPVREETVELAKGVPSGPSAFWKHVYDTVRVAAPFPFTLDEAIESVKFAQLMKKTSPFGK